MALLILTEVVTGDTPRLPIDGSADQPLEKLVGRIVFARPRACPYFRLRHRGVQNHAVGVAQFFPSQEDVLVSGAEDFNENVRIDQDSHDLLSRSNRSSRRPRRKRRMYFSGSENSGRSFHIPTTACMAFLRSSRFPRYCSRAARRTRSEMVVPWFRARMCRASHRSSSKYNWVLFMMYIIHRQRSPLALFGGYPAPW
jgi:hypothetical protein